MKKNLVDPPPVTPLMLNDLPMWERAEKVTVCADIVNLYSTKERDRVSLFTKKDLSKRDIETIVDTKIDELVKAYSGSEITLEIHYCFESIEAPNRSTRARYLRALKDIVSVLEKKAILEDIRVLLFYDDFTNLPHIRRVK